MFLLDCTPQAFKACAHPTSRWKKEPGINNKNLMGRGAYTSEAGFWSDTLLRTEDSGQGLSAILALRKEGEITSYRGVEVRWTY